MIYIIVKTYKPKDYLGVKIKEFDREVIAKLVAFLRENKNLLEVPVAASIYDQDSNLIVQTRNLKEIFRDPTFHAEILAIRKTAEIYNNYNLEGFSLYVTLEPCLMCAGAIIEAKISRLIIGALRNDTNFFSTVELIRNFNNKIEIISSVEAKECSAILSNWFSSRRRARE